MKRESETESSMLQIVETQKITTELFLALENSHIHSLKLNHFEINLNL